MSQQGVSYSGLLPEGWTVFREDTEGLGGFEVKNLELVIILEGKELFVWGFDICNRARDKGVNLSLKDGKYILDHQDEIPKEFRPYWILLPGTLVRDHDVGLYVPLLFWDGERWYLDFHRLEIGWSFRVRFVRPRK